MKQSIQLRLGQQLTMTPQLQQAIRLLQLSMLDLRQEIQEALDSNPMLENLEEETRLNGDEGIESRSESPEAAGAAADPDQELRPESTQIPDELPVDTEWTDHYDIYLPGSGAASQEGGDFDFLARQSKPQSLQDHLHWQLNLSRMDATEMAVATAIVDAIDENGYLTATPEDLLETLGGPDMTLGEVEAVLHRIQALDPSGVGALDLRECLLIQLRQLPEAGRIRDLAIGVCERHFDALSNRATKQIRRALHLSEEDMAEITALIRSLHPHPGALIADVQTQYVIPDVIVFKRSNSWVVELNQETAPRLRVNPDYAKLIRRGDRSDDNSFLKSHLQEARWFIKSLDSRNETVLRVASKIVELQRGFLEQGEEAMKPLVLRDVAEALDLHESTVSRVTTQKYMYTPRGTFELKYFFSSRVGKAGSGERSSTAIRAFIRKLVAAENPRKPLSDNKIAAVLAEQGIKVARRTVAKYREGMGIAPSNERKRLD